MTPGQADRYYDGVTAERPGDVPGLSSRPLPAAPDLAAAVPILTQPYLTLTCLTKPAVRGHDATTGLPQNKHHPPSSGYQAEQTSCWTHGTNNMRPRMPITRYSAMTMPSSPTGNQRARLTSDQSTAIGVFAP